MEPRKLGNSNLHFTSIGLGTFAMGGSGWKASWGPQDDNESRATIRGATEAGINWIDTAPVYGLGHSEEVIGSVLAKLSPRPLIATKCCRIWDETGNISYHLKRASIREEIEASLRRLRIETIDLYQLHWGQPDEDIEEGWSTVAELISEGKVRYGGVCNFSVEQLKRAQSIHPVTSLQTPYSLLGHQLEKELLPFCADHNIGVLVYSPLNKGLLTGKFSHQWAAGLHPEDHRRRDPDFTEPRFEIHLDLMEKLKTLSAGSGMTPAQLSVAWTLRDSAVTSAIVGSRQPEQLAEIVKAGRTSLSEEILNTVATLLREHRENLRSALN